MKERIKHYDHKGNLEEPRSPIGCVIAMLLALAFYATVLFWFWVRGGA